MLVILFVLQHNSILKKIFKYFTGKLTPASVLRIKSILKGRF